MKLLKAPFREGQPYDRMFSRFISSAKYIIKHDNRDFMLVCVGDVGTGKSSLSLHAYDEYTANPDINAVAFRKEELAGAIKRAVEATGDRFLIYDEANVTGRNSLTKWNKELSELYKQIRGANIFHWWNNPNIEGFDKEMIQRLDAVILIRDKWTDWARRYYYFKREALIEILSKEKNIRNDTLYKNKHKALYMGRFKKYDGVLWAAYERLKERRIKDVVADFADKWTKGEEISLYGYQKRHGGDFKTIKRAFQWGIDKEQLLEGEDYRKAGSSTYLSPSGVEKVRKIHSEGLYKGGVSDNAVKSGHNSINARTEDPQTEILK